MLKYQIIIEDMVGRIRTGKLKTGDYLPSITEISRSMGVARETVVKAYGQLRKEGVIGARQGKGFYVLRETVTRRPRIFLLLNGFNASMQVLYNALLSRLGEQGDVDLFFHHHNGRLFRSLIEEHRQAYTHYIIKPTQAPEVEGALTLIPPEELLVLDRKDFIIPGASWICQDFRDGMREALLQGLDYLKLYRRIVLLRSGINPHPVAGETAFVDFCREHSLPGVLMDNRSLDEVSKEDLFLVFSEDDLVRILDLAALENLNPGSDLGILAYNDFPLFPYVSGGVSSISVDFREMGHLAARFVLESRPVRQILPTNLIRRRSF